MTLEQYLESINERLKAATPGPWSYDCGNCEVEGPEGCHVATVSNNSDDRIRDCWDDGDLIAAAPADLKNLLEVVDKLLNVVRIAADENISQFEKVAEAERVLEDLDAQTY